MGGWAGGWFFQEILPLRGSILQAGTCQILSLAENPRWSRVWQYLPRKKYFNCGRLHNFLNKLNCIQIKTPEVDWYMAICHNIYFVPELFVLLIPVSWKRKSYIFLEANSSCYQTYFQLSNPVVIETLAVQKVVVYGRCQVALTVVGQGYDVGIQWLPHPGIVT